MSEVLYFFGEIDDRDVDWLAASGAQQVVPKGETLVHQGRRPRELFILLSGRVAVTSDDKKIAELMRGEVVGELSFLDSRPAGATVTASEDCRVLALDVSRLSNKLRTDSGFASRFYRGVCMMLAARLRDTVGQLVYGNTGLVDNDGQHTGELPLEMLESLGKAAARFDTLLQRHPPR